jgi:hypothetical protein
MKYLGKRYTDNLNDVFEVVEESYYDVVLERYVYSMSTRQFEPTGQEWTMKI